MASSIPLSEPPPPVEDDDLRNWAELPSELMADILHRLGAVEILTSAQMVCKAWRLVSKDPSMWREIDMRNSGDEETLDYDLEVMCLHAIDRSLGGLVNINIEYFGTDSLLASIADRSNHLSRLRLVSCYDITSEGLIEAVIKLTSLEDLEVSCCSMSGDTLRAVGRSCPRLKTFKLNFPGDLHLYIASDDGAIAIAQTMPQLRHLQLLGNRLTETGLNAILNACPHLEHLDLRKCFYINLVGNLKKRCSENIKDVKHPDDPTDDDEYFNEYSYGFSGLDLLSDDDWFSNISDYEVYDYDYYGYDFF